MPRMHHQWLWNKVAGPDGRRFSPAVERGLVRAVAAQHPVGCSSCSTLLSSRVRPHARHGMPTLVHVSIYSVDGGATWTEVRPPCKAPGGPDADA